MGTILIPNDSAAASAHANRVLAITANLLPVEIVESRRARRAARAVVSTLAVFAVLLGGWFVAATYQSATAKVKLEEATKRVTENQRQQRQYSEVTSLETQSQAIAKQLAALLASDLPWSTLLQSVRSAAPTGVRLTALTGALATPGEAAAAPGAGAAKTIGSLNLTGASGNKAQVAAYLVALAKVPGVANPQLISITQDGPEAQFNLKADVTAAVLGGRFTAKPGATKAGGS